MIMCGKELFNLEVHDNTVVFYHNKGDTKIPYFVSESSPDELHVTFIDKPPFISEKSFREMTYLCLHRAMQLCSDLQYVILPDAAKETLTREQLADIVEIIEFLHYEFL